MNIRDLPEWQAYQTALRWTLSQPVAFPADLDRLAEAEATLLTAIANETVKATCKELLEKTRKVGNRV